jgi:hypothetical protein
MLSPTHGWSRSQKWLIIAASTMTIGLVGIGIYIYERYHRGPSDSVLVGTWELEDGCIDCTNWIILQADHKVVGFGEGMGRKFLDYRGRWYAGGELLVIHYDTPEESQSIVMRILDISGDAIRVRWSGRDMRLIRSTVAPPQASNKTLQPTARTASFLPCLS